MKKNITSIEQVFQSFNKLNKYYQKISMVSLPLVWDKHPPLGVACVASFLRTQNYEVIEHDFNIDFFSKLSEKQKDITHTFMANKSNHKIFNKNISPLIFKNVEKWAQSLANDNTDIIGFSVWSNNIDITMQVSERLKEIDPNKIIVLGGPFFFIEDLALTHSKSNFIDFIVCGEGELAFSKLIEVLNKKEKMQNAFGVIHHGRFLGKPKLLENYNSLPTPSFENYPIDLYKNKDNCILIPLQGSRGCIGNCSFCSEKNENKYRFKKAETIMQQILQYNTFFKNKKIYYYFVDSLINANVKELNKLCDFIIDSNINITWEGKAVFNKGMTSELLQKMHKAGCIDLQFGLESASQSVLTDMNKKFKIDLASNIIKQTHAANISVSVFWIIGFPTESELDFQASVNFLKMHEKYITKVIPGYGCHIPIDTDLSNNSAKYNVYWKDGNWYSKHTTPEIRTIRVKKFRALCASLDVEIIYD